MKKVLFVAMDRVNPPTSGYSEAERWAERNAPEGWYITSHLVGARTLNTDPQRDADVYAYEVCVNVKEEERDE